MFIYILETFECSTYAFISAVHSLDFCTIDTSQGSEEGGYTFQAQQTKSEFGQKYFTYMILNVMSEEVLNVIIYYV